MVGAGILDKDGGSIVGDTGGQHPTTTTAQIHNDDPVSANVINDGLRIRDRFHVAQMPTVRCGRAPKLGHTGAAESFQSCVQCARCLIDPIVLEAQSVQSHCHTAHHASVALRSTHRGHLLSRCSKEIGLSWTERTIVTPSGITLLVPLEPGIVDREALVVVVVAVAAAASGG